MWQVRSKMQSKTTKPDKLQDKIKGKKTTTGGNVPNFIPERRWSDVLLHNPKESIKIGLIVLFCVLSNFLYAKLKQIIGFYIFLMCRHKIL